MDSDKKASVRSFLLAVKYATQSCVIATVRQKNVDTMSELELTDKDVRNEILGLSVDDFCEGPLKDERIQGDLWIFGKVVRGKEVYIKLKLSGDKSGHGVKVLSFHFPEAPMQYPFK